MPQDLTLAVQTIAAFPITDPANMDAVNMRDIASKAMLGATSVRPGLLATAKLDLVADALRRRSQAGKTLNPWHMTSNSAKKKWRDLARFAFDQFVLAGLIHEERQLQDASS